jgi:8-oxo-dGTP pyrophosphatase MutT (NUDIX family)
MSIEKRLQRLDGRRQGPHTVTAGRETGFGGGVLIFAADSKKFLWIKRSATGDFAGHWCCPGGGIEDFETIDQGVHRECQEEIGFFDRMDLQHMHRDVQPNFVFHNHVAVIPSQFVPKLNAEHTEYVWATEAPTPLHPRLAYSLSEWEKRNAGN